MEQKKYVYFKSHLAHILWHPYRTLSNRRSHRAAARQPWIAEEEEEVERREEEKKNTCIPQNITRSRWFHSRYAWSAQCSVLTWSLLNAKVRTLDKNTHNSLSASDSNYPRCKSLEQRRKANILLSFTVCTGIGYGNGNYSSRKCTANKLQ